MWAFTFVKDQSILSKIVTHFVAYALPIQTTNALRLIVWYERRNDNS